MDAAAMPSLSGELRRAEYSYSASSRQGPAGVWGTPVTLKKIGL